MKLLTVLIIFTYIDLILTQSPNIGDSSGIQNILQSQQEMQSLMNTYIMDYNSILARIHKLETSEDLNNLFQNLYYLSSSINSLHGRIQSLSDTFEKIKIDSEHSLASHSYIHTTGEFIHDIMDQVTSIEKLVHYRELMKPLEQKLNDEEELSLKRTEDTLNKNMYSSQVVKDLTQLVYENRTYFMSVLSAILLGFSCIVCYSSSKLSSHHHID